MIIFIFFWISLLVQPELVTAAIIPIKSLSRKNNYFLVEVMIKKVGKTRMLVDTGAKSSYLAKWVADYRKIPTTKDEKGQRFVQNLSLRLGTYSFKKRRFRVIKVPVSYREKNIGGVINPQLFFKGKKFILDMPQKKIFLGKIVDSELDSKTEVGGFYTRNCQGQSGKFIVNAKVNGTPGEFYLDTGGVSNYLSKNFIKKIKGSKNRKFWNLKIGKSELKQKFRVINIISSCKKADGRLGNQFLKKYSIYFSSDRSFVRILN